MDRHLRSGRDDCCAHILIRNVVKQVEWTRHAGNSLSGHVRVDHSRFEAVMPEQHLNGASSDAAFDQMGRETVPKGVAMNGLVHSRRSPGCGHGTLD